MIDRALSLVMHGELIPSMKFKHKLSRQDSTPFAPASGGQWKDVSGGQFVVAFVEDNHRLFNHLNHLILCSEKPWSERVGRDKPEVQNSNVIPVRVLNPDRDNHFC